MFTGDLALTAKIVPLSTCPSLTLGDFNSEPSSCRLVSFLTHCDLCFPVSPSHSGPVFSTPLQLLAGKEIGASTGDSLTGSMAQSTSVMTHGRTTSCCIIIYTTWASERPDFLQFTVKPLLTKPEHITDEAWETALRQEWKRQKCHLPTSHNWKQLCDFTDSVCRAALRNLGSTRKPTTNQKGADLKVSPVVQPHRTPTQGTESIYPTRLRRFWRRTQAWRKNFTINVRDLKIAFVGMPSTLGAPTRSLIPRPSTSPWLGLMTKLKKLPNNSKLKESASGGLRSAKMSRLLGTTCAKRNSRNLSVSFPRVLRMPCQKLSCLNMWKLIGERSGLLTFLMTCSSTWPTNTILHLADLIRPLWPVLFLRSSPEVSGSQSLWQGLWAGFLES